MLIFLSNAFWILNSIKLWIRNMRFLLGSLPVNKLNKLRRIFPFRSESNVYNIMEFSCRRVLSIWYNNINYLERFIKFISISGLRSKIIYSKNDSSVLFHSLRTIFLYYWIFFSHWFEAYCFAFYSLV